MMLVYGFEYPFGASIGELTLLIETDVTSLVSRAKRMVGRCKDTGNISDNIPSRHRRRSKLCGVVSRCHCALSNMRSARDQVHYSQRLSTVSDTGINETLSDCVRIMKTFRSTKEIEVDIGAGTFQLYSEQLRADITGRIPLPKTRHDTSQWSHQWSGHFERIKDLCSAAVLSSQDEVALARLKASNDTSTMSIALYNSISVENDAAKRCVSAMLTRTGRRTLLSVEDGSEME